MQTFLLLLAGTAQEIFLVKTCAKVTASEGGGGLVFALALIYGLPECGYGTRATEAKSSHPNEVVPYLY